MLHKVKTNFRMLLEHVQRYSCPIWRLQWKDVYLPTAYPKKHPFGIIYSCPVTLKMTVFWAVAPCRLVEVYQHFRGKYLLPPLSGLSLIALMMEAASTSETLVNFYQTTQH
jgi:hypothetical protein